MVNKQTIYSKIIISLTGLLIAFGVGNILSALFNFILDIRAGASNVEILVYGLIIVLSIIGLVILTIFFIKLYDMAPNVIKWTHITCGYLIFQGTYLAILGLFSDGLIALIGFLVESALVLLFWITFVNHLKKIQNATSMPSS